MTTSPYDECREAQQPDGLRKVIEFTIEKIGWGMQLNEPGDGK